MEFKLYSQYQPTGDQPEAIAQIVERVNSTPKSNTTLKGVTGSGKTFTMANVIAQLGRPTLVLSHNKTLAAQLYGEFRNFFPDNAVEFFVSYYDYYQPESYNPASDKYIEKDLAINKEIEKLRLHTTTTLLSGRRDVIVVASVSAIFGLGNPDDFEANSMRLKAGDSLSHKRLMYSLVDAAYTRTERELTPATFRVSGDSIDIMTAYGGGCYRVVFYDDQIEEIQTIDPVAGNRLSSVNDVKISPANIFVTTKPRIAAAIGEIYVDMGRQVAAFEQQGCMVEAQRLKQRVEYDLEMIKELGYCSGIENYSRYFDRRKPGQPPFCLLNYFPDDIFTIVDESHVMLPQIRAMYGGDSSRKQNLVKYGFRLEAALDNRPLTMSEFEEIKNDTLYVSATPADYEIEKSGKAFVEQLIRPTGLVDPPILPCISDHYVDDALEEIDAEIAAGNKVIVTTITKVSAEEISRHMDHMGVRNRYIHSEIDTLERVAILRDLRNNKYDVLVGVNLLREGLDLPNVGLVIILDGEATGFMRNKRSLIQIAGRAARHPQGRVLLYSNIITDAIREAISEGVHNRERQVAYNLKHKQTPHRAQKSGDNGESLLPTELASLELASMNLTATDIETLGITVSELTSLGLASVDSSPTAVAPLSAPPKMVPLGQIVQQPNYNNSAYPLFEQHYRKVSDVSAPYEASPPKGSIDDAIAKAEAAMEKMAKEMKFAEATKYRELMYKLIETRDKGKTATPTPKGRKRGPSLM